MNIFDRLSTLANRNLGKRGSKRAAREDARRLLFEQMEDRRLMAVIDLATLSSQQGRKIYGIDTGDFSGNSVGSAGDINGDGYDDMIIGAPVAKSTGNLKSRAGETYVVFGGPSMPGKIELANLGTAGITIFGANASDFSGVSVNGAGDVNGDGFADLIVGAFTADAFDDAKEDAGESYLIFGRATFSPTIDLANLGSTGITIFGAAAGNSSGIAVSGAGDVNGDGFDDLLIGAQNANASLIFGAAFLPSTIDLANLGALGTAIVGATAKVHTLSGAGDVNGDGFDDLIIVDFGNKSYIIFGGAVVPANINLATLGIAGLTIVGPTSTVGCVSSAGDVNGDGFDDLIIGAPEFDPGVLRQDAGATYVVFGGASLPATLNFTDLGTAGMTILGVDRNDFSGRFVSNAGDLNADGFDDLLIGAGQANSKQNARLLAGESYLIFGSSSPSTTIELQSIDEGSAGIRIYGADLFDFSGSSVSSAGDVNGDGFDDLIIGASGADAFANLKREAGESYLIFGGNGFTSSVTHLGTNVSERLTGTASANVIVGGRGSDTLVGNGGGDVLIGGQGNDVLAVSSMNFKRIVGGNGTDTLRLDGSGLALNLIARRDNRLTGIERIDITGSGNNSLTLRQSDVLNISDTSNTLLVQRNLGDVVNRGTGWTQLQNEVISGVLYEVFRQGQATLKVRAVNTAPIIGAFGSDVAYLAGGLPVLLAENATVTNKNSASFSGGSLTFRLAANGQETDSFAIRNQEIGAGQVGVSGARVTFNGVIIGTVSSTPRTLVITFNANATDTAVQTVLRNATWRHTGFSALSVQPRTVSVSLTDGQGVSSLLQSKLITVVIY